MFVDHKKHQLVKAMVNPIVSESVNIYWSHPYTSACTLGSPFPGAVYRSTGNPNLNSLISNEYSQLAIVFTVNPTLLIIDDFQGPNAFAYWGVTDPGFYGTIYLGIRLLYDELFSMDKGVLAVVGIMAHEFAHILQWKYQSQLIGKLRELHADFLAGYYLGVKNYIPYRDLRAFASSLFTKGDYNFWNLDHHGTPQERVAAMNIGYSLGQLGSKISTAYLEGDKIIRGF
ncbi:MAG: hypothetical protein RID53_02360 [Coleofasciculus sp. B1-GNL1-01]|uniref:hypothetical protein n=1 Tax=Coleofasciculus sp. B1-GNL1-01 TaxID=3068484 RepID=UPI0032F24272